MIKIIVYKELEDYVGLKLTGHAGYADAGYDIVCSAISVLTINLVNSIEKFTDDEYITDTDDGYLDFKFTATVSEASKLLFDSCILGLQAVKEQYGNKYINIKFQEVK